VDSQGTAVFDQATQLFDPTTLPSSGFFDTPTYLGGANAGDDWLDGWTVALDLPLTP